MTNLAEALFTHALQCPVWIECTIDRLDINPIHDLYGESIPCDMIYSLVLGARRKCGALTLETVAPKHGVDI
ncbi:MAG: hypothetical protein PVG72_05965 [Gammaproteobacteria bacterium]